MESQEASQVEIQAPSSLPDEPVAIDCSGDKKDLPLPAEAAYESEQLLEASDSTEPEGCIHAEKPHDVEKSIECPDTKAVEISESGKEELQSSEAKVLDLEVKTEESDAFFVGGKRKAETHDDEVSKMLKVNEE